MRDFEERAATAAGEGAVLGKDRMPELDKRGLLKGLSTSGAAPAAVAIKPVSEPIGVTNRDNAITFVEKCPNPGSGQGGNGREGNGIEQSAAHSDRHRNSFNRLQRLRHDGLISGAALHNSTFAVSLAATRFAAAGLARTAWELHEAELVCAQFDSSVEKRRRHRESMDSITRLLAARFSSRTIDTLRNAIENADAPCGGGLAAGKDSLEAVIEEILTRCGERSPEVLTRTSGFPNGFLDDQVVSDSALILDLIEKMRPDHPTLQDKVLLSIHRLLTPVSYRAQTSPDPCTGIIESTTTKLSDKKPKDEPSDRVDSITGVSLPGWAIELLKSSNADDRAVAISVIAQTISCVACFSAINVDLTDATKTAIELLSRLDINDESLSAPIVAAIQHELLASRTQTFRDAICRDNESRLNSMGRHILANRGISAPRPECSREKISEKLPLPEARKAKAECQLQTTFIGDIDHTKKLLLEEALTRVVAGEELSTGNLLCHAERIICDNVPDSVTRQRALESVADGYREELQRYYGSSYPLNEVMALTKQLFACRTYRELSEVWERENPGGDRAIFWGHCFWKLSYGGGSQSGELGALLSAVSHYYSEDGQVGESGHAVPTPPESAHLFDWRRLRFDASSQSTEGAYTTAQARRGSERSTLQHDDGVASSSAVPRGASGAQDGSVLPTEVWRWSTLGADDLSLRSEQSLPQTKSEQKDLKSGTDCPHVHSPGTPSSQISSPASIEPEEPAPRRGKQTGPAAAEGSVERGRRKREAEAKVDDYVPRGRAKTQTSHHVNGAKKRRPVGRRIEVQGVLLSGTEAESIGAPVDKFGVGLGRQFVSDTKESDE